VKEISAAGGKAITVAADLTTYLNDAGIMSIALHALAKLRCLTHLPSYPSPNQTGSVRMVRNPEQTP
jgi:hypothetical protein